MGYNKFPVDFCLIKLKPIRSQIDSKFESKTPTLSLNGFKSVHPEISITYDGQGGKGYFICVCVHWCTFALISFHYTLEISEFYEREVEEGESSRHHYLFSDSRDPN